MVPHMDERAKSVLMTGLEPATFGFEDQCSTIEPHKLL
jgi:hypothetical protein